MIKNTIVWYGQICLILQVSCEYCKDFECDKALMTDHLEYCEMKPRICRFCELKFLREQYDEHFKLCGSKTKQCPDCKQHVKNRDQNGHKVQCELNQFQAKEEQKVASKYYQKQAVTSPPQQRNN